MSKDEIKSRFKKTKLGRKIFKKFKVTLILFIIVHVLMLVSLVLFVPRISKILSGNFNTFSIIVSILLLISAIVSFVFSIMLVYYDGKIVGCIELFDLMLKAQTKKKDKKVDNDE